MATPTTRALPTGAGSLRAWTVKQFTLHNRTRKSGIDYASAMRLVGVAGRQLSAEYWDVENAPTLTMKMAAVPGKTLIVDKFVAASHLAGYPGSLENGA